MTFFLVFLGLLSVTCLFALWRGGGPERAIAALFLVAWLASIATDSPVPVRYYGVELNYLVIDSLLLIGLLAVARHANRSWPTVATSLQALIVLAHVARAVNPHQLAYVYMIMTAAWPFLQLLVLIVGTALHWRRTAIHGAEPSWTNFSTSVAPIATPPGAS